MDLFPDISIADLPFDTQPLPDAKNTMKQSRLSRNDPTQSSSRRKKLSEVDRKARCRERNRINMRNMRERMKNRLEDLQQTVAQLQEERQELLITVLDDALSEVLNNLFEREVMEGDGMNLNLGDVDVYLNANA
jgi:seryl-tRNA synthetase